MLGSSPARCAGTGGPTGRTWTRIHLGVNSEGMKIVQKDNTKVSGIERNHKRTEEKRMFY